MVSVVDSLLSRLEIIEDCFIASVEGRYKVTVGTVYDHGWWRLSA